MPREDAAGPTDLACLVTAISAAAVRVGARAPLPPWLPPLPDDLRLPAVPQQERAPGRVPPLAYGLVDLPDRQAQEALVLDVEHGGHLLLVGGPRSGRTTALRALADRLATTTPPADVHLYAVDAGGGGLAALAGLPHTGAVADVRDAARVDRLLGRLNAECSRRQALLAAGGDADVAAQRARTTGAGEEPLPYLLLLLDRWEGFIGALDDVDGGRLPEAVLRLVRDGAAAGLRVVLTADRSGLLGRLGALVESKVLLRLPDRADYALAGLSRDAVPAHFPPGRGVRAADGAEVQLAAPDVGSGGLARRDRDAAPDRTPRPFRIDALPAHVTIAEASSLGPPPPGRLPALVGVGGDELRAQWVDLAADGPGFVVAGPPSSGRSTALAAIATSLVAAGVRVVIVDPRRRSALAGVGRIEAVAPTDARDLDRAIAAAGPLAVLVDDAELVLDSAVAPVLEAYVRTARDRDRALVLAGTTADLLPAYRGFVAQARRSGCGLLLGAPGPLDGDLLGVRLPRSVSGGAAPGRATLVARGATLSVQVAHVPG